MGWEGRAAPALPSEKRTGASSEACAEAIGLAGSSTYEATGRRPGDPGTTACGRLTGAAGPRGGFSTATGAAVCAMASGGIEDDVGSTGGGSVASGRARALATGPSTTGRPTVASGRAVTTGIDADARGPSSDRTCRAERPMPIRTDRVTAAIATARRCGRHPVSPAGLGKELGE